MKDVAIACAALLFSDSEYLQWPTLDFIHHLEILNGRKD